MNRSLAYRRVEPVPSGLTLEVASDRVRLIVPPSAVWLERILLLLWVVLTFAQVIASALITIRLRALWASLGAPPGFWKLGPFLFYWGASSILVAMTIMWMVEHFLFCRIPRQIEMTANHLEYSRRGFFGMRSGRYQLSRVTGIRVRDNEGFSGKITRRVLSIRLGRWRRIQVAFPKEKLSMAVEAEAVFKKMLPSN